MLSSDTRPLARTVTTAVQSSHVLAATAASKMEHRRNNCISYWESLDDWEILEDWECGGYKDSRYLFGQALELVDFLQK